MNKFLLFIGKLLFIIGCIMICLIESDAYFNCILAAMIICFSAATIIFRIVLGED